MRVVFWLLLLILPAVAGSWLAGESWLAGRLRLWPDAVPDPAVPRGKAPPPQPVGLASDGVEIRVGSLAARLARQLWKAADGRVEGRLAIYPRDGENPLGCSEAGLIAPQAGALASAMLSGLGRMPVPEDPTGDLPPPLPEPAEGELRLPAPMRGGDLYLGGVRIGPAPRFPQLM